MLTENAVLVRADVGRVYPLAAAVERWPVILPHYRWVRVVGESAGAPVLDMAAWRGPVPVRWWAVQTLDPAAPAIRFRHVGGVTKGMDVEWTFRPATDGVRVAIRHELTLRWPVVGGFAADRVIGPHFVEWIAGRTLRQIKLLAEAAETGAREASAAANATGTRQPLHGGSR